MSDQIQLMTLSLMKYIIRISLFCMVIFCWHDTSAANNTPSDTFRLANEAFQKGAVDDAIQLYQAIADNGFKSLALYYNLGTAYATNENWGEARYYLEKAKLENPLDTRVQKNLEKVKSAIEDPYLYPKYPLFPTIELIHAKAGKSIISLIFLLIFLLLIASSYMRYIRRWHQFKAYNTALAVLLVVIGILLFFEQTYEHFHDRMVIANQTSHLYEVPDLEGEIALEVQHGHKLRIQEELGPWYRVDLADGTIGWIPRDQVTSLKKG